MACQPAYMLRRSLSQTTAMRMRPSTVATATTLTAAACVLSFPVAAVAATAAATVAVTQAVARPSALVRAAPFRGWSCVVCAVYFLVGWRASRSVCCVGATPRSLPALRRVRRYRLPCHRDWASPLCFVARPEGSHAPWWRYRLCEHVRRWFRRRGVRLLRRHAQRHPHTGRLRVPQPL